MINDNDYVLKFQHENGNLKIYTDKVKPSRPTSSRDSQEQHTSVDQVYAHGGPPYPSTSLESHVQNSDKSFVDNAAEFSTNMYNPNHVENSLDHSSFEHINVKLQSNYYYDPYQPMNSYSNVQSNSNNSYQLDYSRCNNPYELRNSQCNYLNQRSNDCNKNLIEQRGGSVDCRNNNLNIISSSEMILQGH